MEIELDVNTSMKMYCDHPDYREHVAELAASIYHTTLLNPVADVDDDGMVFLETEEEMEEFKEFATRVESVVQQQALELSQVYGVPLDSVERDIKECVAFLPKKDLQISFNARQERKLH